MVILRNYDSTMVKSRKYDTTMVKSRQHDGENTILYRTIIIVLSCFHHRSIALSSSCYRIYTIVVSLFRVIIIVLSSIAFQSNTFKGDGPNGIPYSCDTSSYHIWNRISLCVDTDFFFPVVLYFTRVRRLYLSQKKSVVYNNSRYPTGKHEIKDIILPSTFSMNV